MRQAPAGRFTERALADGARPGARPSPSISTRDGDLDLAVASLGVLFPNNARIGAVVAARERRAAALHAARRARRGARAWPTSGPAISTATATSTCRWRSSATTRARRAGCENSGGWRFESHDAAGAVGADQRRDRRRRRRPRSRHRDARQPGVGRDLRRTSTTAAAASPPGAIFGASNEDFGSSWISLADLDGDGDLDVVYSNGDAFDYATAAGPQLERRAVAREHRRRRRSPITGSPTSRARRARRPPTSTATATSTSPSSAPTTTGPAPRRRAWSGSRTTARRDFTLHDLASAPTHLVTLAVGDLTGDGRPDLVTGGMHMSWPVRSAVAAHAVDQHMGRRARDRRRAAVGARRRASPRRPSARGSAAGVPWPRRQLAGALPAHPTLDGLPAPVRDAIVAADAGGAQRAVGRLGRARWARRITQPASRPTALAAYALAARLDRSRSGAGPICAALLLEERGDADGAVAGFEQVVGGRAVARPGVVPPRRARLQARRARRGADGVRHGPATRRPSRRSCRRGSRRAQSVPLAAYARLGLARVALERGQREDGAPGAAGDRRGLSGVRPGARRCCASVGSRARAPPPAARRPAFEAPYVPPADPLLDAVVAASRRQPTCCSSTPGWPRAPATRRGASSCCGGRWPPTRAISTC